MNHGSAHESVSAKALADRVLAVAEIDGLTLSGGEPFEQSLKSLCELLQIIRSHSSLSLMCYTGKTLDQLRRGPRAASHNRILSLLDILVDGPYVDAKNDGSLWKGSANQKIHFLSPKYRHLRAYANSSFERKIEAVIGPDQTLEFTGIPPRGFIQRLEGTLMERGLNLGKEGAEPEA